MSRPVPARLAKLGIRGIKDNIPEGMEVGNVSKDFLQIFRPEMEKVLRRRSAQKAALDLAENPTGR